MNRARPVVIHTVHSLEGGGTERTLVSLLRALPEEPFRHAVVTMRGAGTLSAELPDHVACRPLDARGRSWRTGLGLARLARSWGTALIHARNTGCWNDATVASILTPGLRLVLGFHGLEADGPMNSRQRRSARFGLQAGAWFTSVSEAGRCQLQVEAGIPPQRITLLRNGVDVARFARNGNVERAHTRQEFGFNGQELVVGIVGSLTTVKAHVTLIRAIAEVAAKVPEIRLLVVGDGPLRQELVDRSRAEGIRDQIVFAGRRQDVPRLLAGMDIYACCSLSEGMNNAVLEAMAAGLPIVATDVGDNRYMVRHGVEGYIIEPRNPCALAAALEVLGQRPELRRRLAAAAAVRAQHYTFEETVHAYERFYRSLVPERRTFIGWFRRFTLKLP